MGWCNYYKKKIDGRQSIYYPKNTCGDEQCYKCRWYSKELKKKPFLSLSEEEYKKRYKAFKTFYKTGK